MTWARAYRRQVRSLVLTLTLWLLSQSASAQVPAPPVGSCLGGNCEVGTQVQAQDAAPEERPRSPGYAQAAAWYGLVSGVLSVAGAVTIAQVDDFASEPITRGIWLGHLTLSVPVVAIGSLTSRKRAKVEGHRGSRALGWTVYSGVLSNGVLQWYQVLTDSNHPKPGLTIGIGVLSLFAFLPHAFDAYIAGRAVRVKGLSRRIAATPNGFALRF